MNLLKKYQTWVGFVLLAVAFLLFNLVNSQLFSSARIDFTESKLYTLSDGTKEILSQIDEPIDLYFFFSDSQTSDMPGVRNFANRIESLLQEYALYAGDKLNLEIIDPVPFSEAQDQADEFGMTAVPVNNFGDQIYFGLAGTNLVDTRLTIPFFQPDEESLLEYNITQMVYKLANPEPPTVGFLTEMEIAGGVNLQTGQPTPPLFAYEQIEKSYNVVPLTPTFSKEDLDVDLLLLVQPPQLDAEQVYLLDQYVLGGGKLLVFADPLTSTTNFRPVAISQSVVDLLDNWGVELDPFQLVADSSYAMQVGRQDGQASYHIGILSVRETTMNGEDVITSDLEYANFASAGHLKIKEDAMTTITPLIQSTVENSALIPTGDMQMNDDPRDLLWSFVRDDKQYNMAVRINGSASTMFPDREGEGHVSDSDNINVVVFADTDVLQDWLWVQKQNFLGQIVARPFADNGSLAINAVDNMTGSAELIALRSRGKFERPFHVVNDLRVAAEAEYRSVEESLLDKLEETEKKLRELEAEKGVGAELVMTEEQQQAIDDFQQQRIEIRKELREVRYQLDADIEGLGTWMKVLNIAIMPIVLTILVYLLALLWRRTRARG